MSRLVKFISPATSPVPQMFAAAAFRDKRFFSAVAKPKGYNIRRAQTKDIPQIAYLQQRYFTSKDSEMSLDKIRDLIKRKGNGIIWKYLVAEVGDTAVAAAPQTVIGAAEISLLNRAECVYRGELPAQWDVPSSPVGDKPSDAIAEMIVVAPGYEGLGIGTALMLEASVLAQKCGARRIFAEYSYGNEAASRVAEKAGFDVLSVSSRSYLVGKHL